MDCMSLSCKQTRLCTRSDANIILNMNVGWRGGEGSKGVIKEKLKSRVSNALNRGGAKRVRLNVKNRA